MWSPAVSARGAPLPYARWVKSLPGRASRPPRVAPRCWSRVSRAEVTRASMRCRRTKGPRKNTNGDTTARVRLTTYQTSGPFLNVYVDSPTAWFSVPGGEGQTCLTAPRPSGSGTAVGLGPRLVERCWLRDENEDLLPVSRSSCHARVLRREGHRCLYIGGLDVVGHGASEDAARLLCSSDRISRLRFIVDEWPGFRNFDFRPLPRPRPQR